MEELAGIEIVQIDSTFNRGGYVYDFSDDDFDNFTLESINEMGLKVRYSGSKGKSLTSFFKDKKNSIEKKIKLLEDLVNYNEIYFAKPFALRRPETDKEIKSFHSNIQKCKKILDKRHGIKISTDSQVITENGLKELVQDAQTYFGKDKKVAVEKIWFALERLKSYYATKDSEKKQSAEKIVKDISHNNSSYYDIFNNEFLFLTHLGNNYRVRHHETTKIEIIDDNYYDYFYYRCLALIDLAIKYLN